MPGDEGLVATLVIGGLLIVGFVLAVVVMAAMWRVFAKAGQPGWAAIVPIYSTVVLLQIVGRPLWWLILFFIPVVNIVIGIVVCADLARSFGKGPGFAVGLLLLSFIFFPILAFGDARYLGPAGAHQALAS
jgi:hypothetical protein